MSKGVDCLPPYLELSGVIAAALMLALKPADVGALHTFHTQGPSDSAPGHYYKLLQYIKDEPAKERPETKPDGSKKCDAMGTPDC